MVKKDNKIFLEWLIALIILGTSFLFLGSQGIFALLSLMFLWFFLRVVRSFIIQKDKKEGKILVFLIIYFALSILIDIDLLRTSLPILSFKMVFGSYLFYVGLKAMQTKKITALRGIPFKGNVAFYYGLIIFITSLILLFFSLILNIIGTST